MHLVEVLPLLLQSTSIVGTNDEYKVQIFRGILFHQFVSNIARVTVGYMQADFGKFQENNQHCVTTSIVNKGLVDR